MFNGNGDVSNLNDVQKASVFQSNEELQRGEKTFKRH